MENYILEEEDNGKVGKMIQRVLDEQNKKKWARLLEEKYNVTRGQNRSRMSMLTGMVIATAATLLLFLYFNFMVQAPGAKEMAQNYIHEWSNVVNPLMLRKDGASRAEIKHEAYVLAGEQRFDDAITKINHLSDEDMDALDNFYFGVWNMKKEVPNYKVAIASLNKSRELKGPLEEITWILILAHILNQDNDTAKKEIAKLRSKGKYKLEALKRLEGNL